MKTKLFKMLLISTGLLCAGCAGPTTPLGAIWATRSENVKAGPVAFIAGDFEARKKTELAEATPKIHLTPARQILHGPFPLTVVIEDPEGIKSNYRLIVRHNGLDVTTSFLRQARTYYHPNGKKLYLHVSLVRLPPRMDHLIEFFYGGKLGAKAYARFDAPDCRAFDQDPILSTDRFSPNKEILSLIDRVSRETGFNPAFTAALIAQESGFNPRTVSWAKAIGLTQVTPIADDELRDEFSSWPRYPGIEQMPTAWLKSMVYLGKIHENNDWRLKPEQSIRGGLTYAKVLAQKLASPEVNRKMQATFTDEELEQTKFLLASYHSGYSRVMNAFETRGANWLQARQLREARKYVNRILSYCEQFSTPDAEDAAANELMNIEEMLMKLKQEVPRENKT